ncbi:MAG: glycosyltransferase [Bacteroides sp.]|nr:glycosyltransferase [Bacteroides sp.]
MIVIFKNDAEYFDYMVDCDGMLCNKDMNNNFLQKICNVHRSVKLNKVFNMPFKSIWYKYYLDYEKIDTKGNHLFVFFEGNQLAYDAQYINFLRKKYINSKFVFRYTNITCYLNEATQDYVDKVFDLVITMDKRESTEKKRMYFHNTYNMKIADSTKKTIKYDLFFVGRDKGRHDILIQICEQLSKDGVKCKFLISGVAEKKRKKDVEGIQYINLIEYDEVVNYIKESRCILEILQNNQFGSSLRPMEAIAYGCKLVTNDKGLKDNEYYDENNMLIIDDYAHMDADFIRTPKQKEYKDKNIIASDKLFDTIIQYFASDNE